MKTTSTFVILIAILSFCAFTVHAEKSQNDSNANPLIMEVSSGCLNEEFSVTVTSKKGKPLSDVKVSVVCRSKLATYGRTDDTGVFKFKADKICAYDITAKKSDYDDAKININVSICTAGTTTPTTSATTFETTSTNRPSAATTTIEVTTTVYQICNDDRICEGEENYRNCPGDCPSSSKDNYCDGIKDDTCDQDCYRRSDPDCLCNRNGYCEENFENYENCPSDCPSGAKDGYCDRVKDGKCDQDCNETDNDPDCIKIDPPSIILSIAIIILAFGALAYYNIRREMGNVKTERNKEDLIDGLKERLRQGEDPETLKKELIAGGHDPSLLEKAEKGLWS